MVIEEPLLGEILVTSLTDERPLSTVNTVVDVKMRFPGVSLLTNCAYEGFLACVHAHVLLQRVVIVASFFAHWAHKV